MFRSGARAIAFRYLVATACIACLTGVARGQSADCSEPGWNSVDVAITLTGNQPTYWSAATGSPASVAPFPILDPGPPPGRPSMDGRDERVLRGFIVAWAVNANGEEIRWNHLLGNAVVVNYARGTAWEYNANSFQVVNAAIANGMPTGTPGQLFLNGAEYANGYDVLLLDFYAPLNIALPNNTLATFDSELTLMPLKIDLRQETTGPVTTKASFTIWNQNEVKLTGLDRCVTCWDDTPLSWYGIPNHFLLENLQTAKGKARIDGLASQLCDVDFDPGDTCTQVNGGPAPACDPRDVLSEASSLIGVVAKQIAFTTNGPFDAAGMNLIGMGEQSGSLQVDFAGSPPDERPGQLEAPGRTPVNAPQPMISSALVGEQRTSASEKGSLLIFPLVELRWDALGTNLVQDTFISLTNDYPDDVKVQMYFVQGDPAFTPGPADLNTNGVPDDCEDRLRWSCHVRRAGPGTQANGCRLNPNGPFASLADCVLNCDPEPTRYTCDGESKGPEGPTFGECVPDPEGEFETLAECEENCIREMYYCNPYTQGCDFVYRPASYLNMEGYYADEVECFENCSRYSCNHVIGRGVDGQIGCYPDPCGEYANLNDCLNSCGVRTYDCNSTDEFGLPNANCKPAGTTGEYLVLDDCNSACETQRYSCSSEITAFGTCFPDDEGPYRSLEECTNCCGAPQYQCGAIRNPLGGVGPACIPVEEGQYESFGECADDCPFVAYRCTVEGCVSEVGTIGILQEPNVYLTMGECEEKCSRHTCTNAGMRGIEGIGFGCIPDPCGEYATYNDCINSCGVRHYSCTGELRAGFEPDCVVDENGLYSTLSDCHETCPSAQRYSCAPARAAGEGGICVPNNEGEFYSLEDCLHCCGAPRYSCSIAERGTDSGCTIDPNGAYATLEDCEAECVIEETYTCVVVSKDGPACVPQPSGEFATFEDCEASCGSDLWDCHTPMNRGAVDGTECVVTPGGGYQTKSECEFGCIERYSCQFDTNGGFCVLDPSGPLTEADCLANVCSAPALREASETKTKSKSK
ncbi:MAG: hypothetical protein H6817_00665 [Phycisphaerales bacterium]|nr:hypothetical protein [Phycisphaerales bacterium]